MPKLFNAALKSALIPIYWFPWTETSPFTISFNSRLTSLLVFFFLLLGSSDSSSSSSWLSSDLFKYNKITLGWVFINSSFESSHLERGDSNKAAFSSVDMHLSIITFSLLKSPSSMRTKTCKPLINSVLLQVATYLAEPLYTT